MCTIPRDVRVCIHYKRMPADTEFTCLLATMPYYTAISADLLIISTSHNSVVDCSFFSIAKYRAYLGHEGFNKKKQKEKNSNMLDYSL